MRKRRLVVVGIVAIAGYLYLRPSGPTEEELLVAKAQHVLILERLASSPVGRLDDLSRALSIADRNRGRWDELRLERPNRPFSDYPEGEAAVAALGRWGRDHDAMTPLSVRMSLFALAKMAIETATPSAPGGLEAGQLAGHRLLMNGAGVMDGMLGASLLELAAAKTRVLGLPSTIWWMPPRSTFGRVLAAEALWARRTYAPSPFADRVVAFWADVLIAADHEQPGETLARFRSKSNEEIIRTKTVEDLAERIARLQAL